MLPAISVNKGGYSHQIISLQLPQQWALWGLRTETNGVPTAKPSATAAPPSPNCTCWGDSGWRKAGYWPQIAEVSHRRNDFKEPGLLYPPIHRKVLNCLTWDIWFSLISSHLLMFQPPVFVAKLLHILAPCLASLEQSEWSEMLGPGLEVCRMSLE